MSLLSPDILRELVNNTDEFYPGVQTISVINVDQNNPSDKVTLKYTRAKYPEIIRNTMIACKQIYKARTKGISQDTLMAITGLTPMQLDSTLSEIATRIVLEAKDEDEQGVDPAIRLKYDTVYYQSNPNTFAAAESLHLAASRCLVAECVEYVLLLAYGEDAKSDLPLYDPKVGMLAFISMMLEVAYDLEDGALVFTEYLQPNDELNTDYTEIPRITSLVENLLTKLEKNMDDAILEAREKAAIRKRILKK
jgi:hypothetical protein